MEAVDAAGSAAAPAAAAEMEPSLVELFAQQKFPEAVEFLRQSDSAKVKTEIMLAFAAVPSAPSAFLQCVRIYGQLQGKEMTYISPWVEVAVACINTSKDIEISAADSSLAGVMLSAFHRSRMSFVAAFARAYRVDVEALSVFCVRLLQKRVGSAVQFMESLKKKHLLPPQQVLQAAIKQKDFRAGDVYAKGNPEMQRLFVQMLLERNVQDKVIKKRLSLFKIDASEFPVYLERKQKATLRYLVYSQSFEDALKLVEGSEDLKMYACKMIIRHAGAQDAATKQFVFRSGLARFFPEVDTSQEKDKKFKEKEDLAPLDTCLSLAAIIGEANIVFVDTLASLQECSSYLLTQSVVGFDSEWKAVHVAAGPNELPTRCALVQVASREKAFVVDLLALHEHAHLLAPVFQSDQIVKLGFDTRGDIKALRPFLVGSYPTEYVMSGLLDMQVVAKKLLPQGAPNGDAVVADDDNTRGNANVPDSKQSAEEKPRKKMRSKRGNGQKTAGLSLTAVAEKYLGLPLDKRTRMSDWERRPLTQAQFHYAALDAHVLVQIYEKMQQYYPSDVFGPIVNRCMQKNIK